MLINIGENKVRKITITEDTILIEGFSGDDFRGYAKDQMGSCRDVARFGMTWAAKRIADDLNNDASGDWDNQTSCIGD